MKKQYDWISIIFLVLMMALSLYFAVAQINSTIIQPCADWPSGCYMDQITYSGGTLLFLSIFPIAVIILSFVSLRRINTNKTINTKISKINLYGLIIIILTAVISLYLTWSCFSSGGEKCTFNFIFLIMGYLTDIVLIIYSLSIKN